MAKVINTIIGLAIMLILSACASTEPQVSFGSMDYLATRVEVKDSSVKDSLKVDVLEGEKNGKRVLQFAVYNKTDEPVQFNYRFEWFNDEGIMLNHTRIKHGYVKPDDWTFYQDFPSVKDANIYRLVVSKNRNNGW